MRVCPKCSIRINRTGYHNRDLMCPAKLEVKFTDERTVFEIVYHSVRKALEEHEYRPEMELSQKTPKKNLIGAYLPIGEDGKGEQIRIGDFKNEKTYSGINARSDTEKDHKPTYRSSGYDDAPLRVSSGKGYDYSFSKEQSKEKMTPVESLDLLKKYQNSPSSAYTKEGAVEPQKEDFAIQTNQVEYRFVGEAFNCYLLVEYEDALLVIDKHAAHERIIFEDIKRSREKDGRVPSQMLMLPITVLLSHEEASAIADHIEEIKSVGFDLHLENTSCDLLAIPEAISSSDAESLIIKMADDIVDGRGDPAVTEAIRREKALYQIACKAAIKGGRRYDDSIHKWLVEKVLSMPEIIVCPHGRPIAYRLKKNELDKQFDRIK